MPPKKRWPIATFTILGLMALLLIWWASFPHPKAETPALFASTAQPEVMDVRRELISLMRLRIFVFTYNRPEGLSILVASLLRSNYTGGFGTIDLEIFVDFRSKWTADQVSKQRTTLNQIENIVWPYGSIRVHRRIRNVGLRASIMEAWYPMSEWELGVFLEDDTEVSKWWYHWVVSSVAEYGLSNSSLIESASHILLEMDSQRHSGAPWSAEQAQKIRSSLPWIFDPHMAGISLYRSSRDQLSRRLMESTLMEESRGPFIFQQPCSWGAVYFATPWRSFRRWFEFENPGNGTLSNPADPEVKPLSNTWDAASSWKKFLIYYMYWNGQYMVYPHLPGRYVLSTTHLLQGTHHVPPSRFFDLPLLPDNLSSVLQDALAFLPPLENLRVFDVMFRRVNNITSLPNYKVVPDL